jgi:hypothetical protein
MNIAALLLILHCCILQFKSNVNCLLIALRSWDNTKRQRAFEVCNLIYGQGCTERGSENAKTGIHRATGHCNTIITNSILNFRAADILGAGAVAYFIESLWYMPEGRRLESRWGHCISSIYLIHLAELWPWGSLSLWVSLTTPGGEDKEQPLCKADIITANCKPIV